MSESTSADVDEQRKEAVALCFLRSGDVIEHLQPTDADLKAVTDMLHLEAQGLSDCGCCEGCIKDSTCLRAANRRAATEGNQGARWAEEAT